MRPSDVVVREATPADNDDLCALFAGTTMDGDLRLAVERSPNFFGLYDLQRLTARRVFVAEVEGKVEGVATFLARPGWLEGQQTTVGYLGDLRLSPKVRGGFFFGRRFGQGLAECLAAAGVEVGTTAILGSNAAAIRFLTKRSKRFSDKPVYRLWKSFQITNLHFTRRRRPRRTSLEVRNATAADLPAIAARLAEDHSGRAFGYVVDEDLLRARLASWPGLGVEDFVLAFRSGELVGVAAPWDAHAIKRFVVVEYGGSLRWVRAGFNAGSLLFRYPKLPPVGAPMRYAYLTHVSVQGEDPAVMTALVDRIYADRHGDGWNFLTVFVDSGDPLASAYARYQTTPIPANLFTVSMPGSRFNDWDPGPGRPGFEMALV